MRISLVPKFSRSLILTILNGSPFSLICFIYLKILIIYASRDLILHLKRSDILKVMRLISRLSRYSSSCS